MSKDGESMKGTYFISSISTTSFLVEYGILSIFTLFLLYVLDFSIPLTLDFVLMKISVLLVYFDNTIQVAAKNNKF